MNAPATGGPASTQDDNAPAIDDLHNRIEQGRSADIDWLPADASTLTIASVLVAMANTRAGGTLLIGIKPEDRPQITGVSDTASAIDRVLQAALLLTPPLILPLPQVTRLDDKPLIVAQIPAGMPHVYALDGRYLSRDGTQNVPLPPRDLRRLFILRGEISFETEIIHTATRDTLNWERVAAYANTMGSKDAEALLIRRGCLARLGDVLRPTHAGMLLFGNDPQPYVRGAEITAVRFAGDKMGDTFNRQDITGTLPDQIRRAETFLRDHLRKGVMLKDTMTRHERFEYPLAAARELVVNAVAHRDYSIAGDGIRLYIFKDHMEITSPGLLPGPVTVANIRNERFSRNPAIVQVLADMGFIERLGYGVDRVIELMREQDLNEPAFSETSGGFMVVLHNATEQIASKDKTPAAEDPAPEKPEEPAAKAEPDAPKTPESVPAPEPIATSAKPEPTQSDNILLDYPDIPLNPRQETAIAYLREPGRNRITNSELQRLHPDVHPETIRRDLSDLVSKDILAKMGEKRGSYYTFKPRKSNE